MALGGPLAPGKPAGVHAAQTGSQVMLIVVGVAVLGMAAALAGGGGSGSGGAANNPGGAVSSTSSTQ